MMTAGLTLAPTGAKAETAVQTVQQANGISGQVVDANGEPIIGATIKLAGGKQAGSITDFNGKFTLKGAKSGSSIVVSYIRIQDEDRENHWLYR